jgi:hypothetical protein
MQALVSRQLISAAGGKMSFKDGQVLHDFASRQVWGLPAGSCIVGLAGRQSLQGVANRQVNAGGR